MPRFGDFNGDGYTDIYLYQANRNSSRTRMYYSTGTGFVYKSSARFDNQDTKSHDIYTLDIDNNGYCDLVRIARTPSSSCVEVSYNQGAYTTEPFTYGIFGINGDMSPENYYFVDLYGNGTYNFFVGEAGVQRRLQLHECSNSRYVSEIMNNRTDRIAFSYFSLNDLPDYARTYPGLPTSLARPVMLFEQPLYVTRKIEHIYNTHSDSTTYGYSAGLFHGSGKGFLGFMARWSVQHQPYRAQLELSNYDSVFQVLYPESTKAFLDSTWTTPVQSSSFTYSFHATGFESNSFKRHQLRLSTILDRDSITTNDMLTTYAQYDSISGNPGIEEKAYYENTNTHGSNYQWKDRLEYSFRNDTSITGWRLGLPMSKTVSLQKTSGDSTSTHSTIFERDALGRVINETSNGVTGTFTYDDFGHIISSSISAAGVETRTDSTLWDGSGRFNIRNVNSLGHVSLSEYDALTGDLVYSKDPLGRETDYFVDYYRVYSSEDGPGHYEVRYMFWEEIGPPEAPQESVYGTLTYTYQGESLLQAFNNGGRLLRKSVVLGSYDMDASTDYIYDSQGRVERASYPYRWGSEPVDWKQYAYDAYGRMSSEVTPWETTTYDYSGNTASTHLETSNRTYTKTKDSKGHLLGTTDPGGSITYGYDTSGNLISTISAGTATTMEYDPMGRQTALVDPNAGRTEYRYNVLGELIMQTSALGDTTSMSYDKLGRMITQTAPEGTYEYVYDVYNYGLQTTVSRPGLLMKESLTLRDTLRHQVEYQYTTQGLLGSEKQTIDGVVYTTNYSWDPDNFYPTVIGYPDDFRIRRVNHANGDIYQLKRYTSDAVFWEGQSGNILGQVTQSKTGNNLTTSKDFDAQGVLQSIRVRKRFGTRSAVQTV